MRADRKDMKTIFMILDEDRSGDVKYEELCYYYYYYYYHYYHYYHY